MYPKYKETLFNTKSYPKYKEIHYFVSYKLCPKYYIKYPLRVPKIVRNICTSTSAIIAVIQALLVLEKVGRGSKIGKGNHKSKREA
jgi:hypothetical protein